MFNSLGYTSGRQKSQNYVSPISMYFPFGQQREKLKSYVFQQLHGDQAIKNAQILNKFRQEAAIRRHRHLHRYSYTEQPQEILKKSIQNKQTLNHFPTLTQNNNQRFANYCPRDYHRYSLIPTQKTPPPIIKYESLDSQQTRRGKTLSKNNPQIYLSMHKTIKNEAETREHRPYYQKRSQSFDIRSSYKDKALQKIKQIAKSKKKGNKDKQDSVYSTDSSQILEQLEYKKQISKVEFKRLDKQLKKFNKYRNYLRKAKDYHF